MSSVTRASLILGPALACCATVALAQSTPVDDGAALRGPSVKSVEAPKTLIKREMTGELVRLDTRPENAAVELLGLTPEQRAGVDKVLTERFAAVSSLLRDHTDLFLKIQAARQGGGSIEELRPLVREMRGYAAGLLEPAFEDQVAAALPEDKRAEFRGLVDEYKKVAAAEEPAGRRGGAKPEDGKDAMQPARPAPAGTMSSERVEMNLLLREMGRALNAVVTERRERLQSLLKAVEATPEQEAQIQAIVREKPAASKEGETVNLGEPTLEQRAARWEKIMAVLTPEQREKAREYRKKEGGGR